MDEFGDWYPGHTAWEEWYAWYPVKDIHGNRHWLKKIYRKYNWAQSTDFPGGKNYDYGTIFDVLAEEHTPQSAPIIGYMRFNTITNTSEVYDGTDWVDIAK